MKRETEIVDLVFSLWPDVNDMAADLRTRSSALSSAMNRRMLPDPEHDDAILDRAKFCEVGLSRDALSLCRRRAQIRAFVVAFGGDEALAAEIDREPGTIRTARHRGHFAKASKYELMQAAAKIKYDLNEALFEPM